MDTLVSWMFATKKSIYLAVNTLGLIDYKTSGI